MRGMNDKRIEEGIRIKKNGYEASFKFLGRQVSKRFPLSTPLTRVRAWRRDIRIQLIVEQQVCQPAPEPLIPRGEATGYCHIYFIRAADRVKIGRSLSPQTRLSEMQTAHADRLDLMATTVAHHSLERLLHVRFADNKMEGEWFALDDDLLEFIAQVSTGVNPVALLWDHRVTVRPRPTPSPRAVPSR